MKGIAYVGALALLESKGYKFSGVGGTSAGSIVASLYAAGYSPSEMQATLMERDLSDTIGEERSWFGVLRHGGLYSTDGLYQWLFSLLKRKGIERFEDLDSTIDLRIVAADLTNREILVFSRERYPTLSIAQAVRMSISIPVVFDPVKFGELLVVDGGVVSNHPIWLFGRGESDTIGFRLRTFSTANVPPRPPKGIREYAMALASTVMSAHDTKDVEEHSYKIIEIDDGGIPTTKFHLSSTEKQKLLESGTNGAARFLLNTNIPNDNKDVSNTPHVVIPQSIQNEWVRVSMSGLCRINVDDLFMLIHSNSRNIFQPVGGVFKSYPEAASVMTQLGVVEDRNVLSAHSTPGELRKKIRAKELGAFVKWFTSRKDRELVPNREFMEELMESHILDPNTFGAPDFHYLDTKYEALHFSDPFQCYEIRIAEIFEIKLSPKQTSILQELKAISNSKVGFFTPKQIRSRGVTPPKALAETISSHSKWILIDSD